MPKTPCRNLWLALAMSAAVPALLAPVARAQEDEAATAQEGEAEAPVEAARIPWDTSCSQAARAEEPDCQMSQMVIVPKSRQVLLRLEIQVPGDRSGPRMVVQLPHGIFLPEGVTLAIDGQEWQQAVVQTCDANGCYVGLDVDEEALRRLREGQQMTVSFQSLSRETVNVPVDLNGFTAAYEKIR